MCVNTYFSPKGRAVMHPPWHTHTHTTGDSPFPSARLWQLCELLGRTRLDAALAEPVVTSWRATRMDTAQQWPSSQTSLSSGPWKRQRCLDLHHCPAQRESYEVCRQGDHWTLLTFETWNNTAPTDLLGEWPVTSYHEWQDAVNGPTFPRRGIDFSSGNFPGNTSFIIHPH